jgi:hypothetical protein
LPPAPPHGSLGAQRDDWIDPRGAHRRVQAEHDARGERDADRGHADPGRHGEPPAQLVLEQVAADLAQPTPNPPPSSDSATASPRNWSYEVAFIANKARKEATFSADGTFVEEE